MTQIACTQCGNAAIPPKAYEVDGKIRCEGCANSAVQQAKSSGQPIKITRYVDRSLCARCNTYIGDPGSSQEGARPRFCQACETLVQNWPYPQWLKLSFAGLLLLLVVALFLGRKYFEAGKNLYRGEQFVERGKYSKALPYLRQTMKVAPASDKGALLTAKAALLSGDPKLAYDVLQAHEGGRFEKGDDPQFLEVERILNRAGKALEDMNQARKLSEQSGTETEVARLLHDAASNYPELPNISVSVDYADAGVAFANKDYDAFTKLAQKDWDELHEASTAAGLASAFACKYAVTGDVAYRQRSEQMLATAKELSQKEQDGPAEYAEYAERIRYRLDSREIIDKAEYDRKFRNRKKAAN